MYDGNKVYLGAYWDDGSEVVGPCYTGGPRIEYKGMSKAEALSWVKTYCPEKVSAAGLGPSWEQLPSATTPPGPSSS